MRHRLGHVLQAEHSQHGVAQRGRHLYVGGVGEDRLAVDAVLHQPGVESALRDAGGAVRGDQGAVRSDADIAESRLRQIVAHGHCLIRRGAVGGKELLRRQHHAVLRAARGVLVPEKSLEGVRIAQLQADDEVHRHIAGDRAARDGSHRRHGLGGRADPGGMGQRSKGGGADGHRQCQQETR